MFGRMRIIAIFVFNKQLVKAMVAFTKKKFYLYKFTTYLKSFIRPKGANEPNNKQSFQQLPYMYITTFDICTNLNNGPKKSKLQTWLEIIGNSKLCFIL